MRIGAPNPGYVLRAYGVKSPAVSKPAAPVALAAAAPQIKPEQPAPASSTVASAAADRLIAGAVSGKVDFNQATPIQPAAPALQLYTRAADKVEAATAIRIGQSIDIRG